MSKITEMQHSSHKHQLKLMCVKKSNYQCAGCKEPGLGSCYQCNKKKCGFHLHEECALASGSGSITHPFFKNCHFIFHDDEPQSDTTLICAACGKNVEGFMYKPSSNKAHVLHPCCLKLPHNKTNDEGVNVNLRKNLSLTSRCQICQSRKISKEIKGWAYVSNFGKHHYHVACAKKMIFDNLNTVQVLETTDGGKSNNSNLTLQVLQQSGLAGTNVREFSLPILTLVLRVIISAISGNVSSIVLNIAYYLGLD